RVEACAMGLLFPPATSIDFVREWLKELWELVAIGYDLSSLVVRGGAQRDGSPSLAHCDGRELALQ
ncbi:hypothetical protein PanWU01x14_010690, partial [Parasponia andersonii]